jgi:hypothetical protein
LPNMLMSAVGLLLALAAVPVGNCRGSFWGKAVIDMDRYVARPMSVINRG